MDKPGRAEVIDWEQIPHFRPKEFDDPDHPGSWKLMDPLTILKLNEIQAKTGWRMVTHNKFGLRGCVCVEASGHSENSRHYAANECDAVDWHFDNDVNPRLQIMIVLRSGFSGIGIYYDWQWGGSPLPIGFHTDLRRWPQIWKREKGKYIYFLE